MPLPVDEVLSMVRRGHAVSDEAFDQIYPQWVRRASEKHWTPIGVARRVIELLDADDRTRILDVGSGAGKFCLLGSLLSPGHFYGIEQRPRLVAAATRVARRCRVERVHFLQGDAFAIDWDAFDAFYFFGPFYEQICDIRPAIEEPIVRSAERFQACLAATTERLSSARMGTRVVTVMGFGAPPPPGYREVASERISGLHLVQLWHKKKRRST